MMMSLNGLLTRTEMFTLNRIYPSGSPSNQGVLDMRTSTCHSSLCLNPTPKISVRRCLCNHLWNLSNHPKTLWFINRCLSTISPSLWSRALMSLKLVKEFNKSELSIKWLGSCNINSSWSITIWCFKKTHLNFSRISSTKCLFSAINNGYLNQSCKIITT